MKWISSTEKEAWVHEHTFADRSDCEITLGAPVGKPIFGWGCCISEICAKAIFSLDADKQSQIFDALFGAEGCGFDYCRLSIGANDFAESWYSYNECEGDFAMYIGSLLHHYTVHGARANVYWNMAPENNGVPKPRRKHRRRDRKPVPDPQNRYPARQTPHAQATLDQHGHMERVKDFIQ